MPRPPWGTLIAGLLLLAAAVGLWGYQAIADAGRPVNVLLLGVDQDQSRTDVVILAHWEPRHQVLSLISLPRDLQVEIPCPPGLEGCRSPDKLAHAHAYGEAADQGPELARATVAGFLGVPVDHYVRVDFAGFARIVDALGGVTIDVEKPLDYDDPYQNLHIHLQPGVQKLDGEKALQYVRFRNDGQGDIGRIGRTQKFFFALLQSLRAEGRLSNLPQLAAELLPYVKTDLDTGTAVSLARAAANLNVGSLRVYSIPGEAKWVDGLWFWVGDPEKTRAIVKEAILEVAPAAEK